MKKLTILFMIWASVAVGQSTSSYQVVTADGAMLYTNNVAHTNYSDITVTNMLLTTYGGTEDLRMPLSTAGRGVGAPPDFETWYGNQRAYAFSGTATEQVFFDVQLPHSWDEGTAINPHLHYDQASGTSTNGVVFKLEYVWANIGNVFTNGGATTLAFTNSLNGTSYWHEISNFPNIDGTGKTYSSMINARLYRDHDDAGDTYTGDIFVHEFDIHYYVLRPGGNTHQIE